MCTKMPALSPCASCDQQEDDCVCVGDAETDACWLEAQLDDPNIGPLMEWLEASAERPPWEEVATTSPATKHL